MRWRIIAGLGLLGIVLVSLAISDPRENADVFQQNYQELQNGIEPRLQWVVGRWVPASNTFDVADTTGSTFVATAIAGGRGVYSAWHQGDEDSGYEAHALWGYHSRSQQVRIFEVNTLGVAETHVGGFDDDNILSVELHDPDTGELRQRRLMRWVADTLYMEAYFYRNGAVTPQSLVLVRQQ